MITNTASGPGGVDRVPDSKDRRQGSLFAPAETGPVATRSRAVYGLVDKTTGEITLPVFLTRAAAREERIWLDDGDNYRVERLLLLPRRSGE